MILKALYDYYHRSGNLAPAGFEEKEIDFSIVIGEDGHFLRVEDNRINKNTSRKFLVVKGSRASAPKPYLFYDNMEYVLNYTKFHEPLSEQDSTNPKKVAEKEKKMAKAQKKHDLFMQQCQSLSDKYPANKGFKAVTRFYATGGIAQVEQEPLWEDMKKTVGANVSFLLQGQTQIMAEAQELANEVENSGDDADHASLSRCLITGEKAATVTTTTSTMIPGSQATAKLVAFQINSGYDSYGKSKGNNAPISQDAEACYTTALNTMLSKNSHNKFFIGTRTFLFWASSNSEASQAAEEGIYSLLGYVDKDTDDPNRRIDQVRQAFTSIYSGVLPSTPDDKFYFLGLAPNVARIAVVYWDESTLKNFAARILTHFADMDIVDGRKDKKPYRGLFQIVTSISLQGQVSNVPPNLPEAIIKSIVQGIPYPFTLLAACMTRIRAEQDVRITCAAIIKAYLNRLKNDNHQKIKVMLDKENMNQGYLCGRLFATLEYLQERSSNGLNSIRSRYMNAASATPSAVFSTIMNLSVHHAEKLDKRSQIFFDQLKSEIVDKISSEGFPTHLSLQDQGRFMVGYYQQRQDFYTKKDKPEVDKAETDKADA